MKFLEVPNIIRDFIIISRIFRNNYKQESYLASLKNIKAVETSLLKWNYINLKSTSLI